MNIEDSIHNHEKGFYECNNVAGSFQITRTKSKSKLTNQVQQKTLKKKITKNNNNTPIKKETPKKYNKVSQDVKDQFIRQILTEQITLESAAKSKGITASTAKYLWQKYKNKMLIKRKKRQNSQKQPLSRNLVFHSKEFELKKSLEEYQYSDPKSFFKSIQIVQETCPNQLTLQNEQQSIFSNQITSDTYGEEISNNIDYKSVNQILLTYLIEQFLKPVEIDQQSLTQLILQKLVEDVIVQQFNNSSTTVDYYESDVSM